jgi:hypothetical protein
MESPWPSAGRDPRKNWCSLLIPAMAPPDPTRLESNHTDSRRRKPLYPRSDRVTGNRHDTEIYGDALRFAIYTACGA